jgi:hypothetical protein
MEQGHKELIEELKILTDCPHNFECYDQECGNFRNPVFLNSRACCRKPEDNTSCKFNQLSIDEPVCACPLRVYLYNYLETEDRETSRSKCGACCGT